MDTDKTIIDLIDDIEKSMKRMFSFLRLAYFIYGFTSGLLCYRLYVLFFSSLGQ